MKKIISFVLAFAMLASVALSLSSCNVLEMINKKDEHKHSFSEVWTTNETQHWHAATCEHTDEKSELADHKDRDYDDKCDACGYDLKVKVDVEDTKTVNYIVDVTDESGAAVAGVGIILISPNGFYTSTKITDANGRVTFALEEGEYTAAIAEALEGYSNTVDERYEFTKRIAKIVLK